MLSSSDFLSQTKHPIKIPKTNENFPNQRRILTQKPMKTFQIKGVFWRKIEAIEPRLFFCLDDHRPNKQTPDLSGYFTSNRLQKANIFKSELFLLDKWCRPFRCFLVWIIRNQTTKQRIVEVPFPQKQTQRKKRKKRNKQNRKFDKTD